ncbi:MAG: hypothetical protein M3Z63_01145 [Gilliamella apicola]|nr:hypothetical protein [Gilliamella apicola]
MSWYKTGTVNVTKNSNIVTGAGTKWTNQLSGVSSGRMLILQISNQIDIYEIESVQSDTQLTLSDNYLGETIKGLKYTIPTSPSVSIEQFALEIASSLAYHQKQLDGWQKILTGSGDVTLTAPDGQNVTIKSQKYLTETINNIIEQLNNRVPIGEFRLMPFRAGELPFGWYFRNGDNYFLSSPQGQALNRLSDNYKRDHQITIKNINGQYYINVPSAFAPDGRGFFERPANGTTRQIGSWEDDAIREIWGHFDTGVVDNHVGYAKGAFAGTYAINPKGGAFQPTRDLDAWGYEFFASRVVPTANENRPLNIGLTPAIYLGV